MRRKTKTLGLPVNLGFAPILALAIIAILGVIGVLSYQFARTSTNTPSLPTLTPNQNWITYTSQKYQVTLNYPPEWIIYENASVDNVLISNEFSYLPQPNKVITDMRGCVFFLGKDYGTSGPTGELSNANINVGNQPFMKRTWYKDSKAFFNYYYPNNTDPNKNFKPTFEALYTWQTDSTCATVLDKIISSLIFKFN